MINSDQKVTLARSVVESLRNSKIQDKLERTVYIIIIVFCFTHDETVESHLKLLNST